MITTLGVQRPPMKNDNGKWMAILACIIGAAVVASTGHDGWCWLLFLAFCLA